MAKQVGEECVNHFINVINQELPLTLELNLGLGFKLTALDRGNQCFTQYTIVSSYLIQSRRY